MIVATTIAAVALFAMRNVSAQPSPDPIPPESRITGATKIPVSMPDDTEVMGAERAGVSSAPAQVPLEHAIAPDKYICGPGDAFELNFWGQQNFRLRIAADLEGRVFISKVGFVSVDGKTLTAVRKEVTRKVRSNYPGLQFELALIGPRTFLVHVVENVKQPGSYTAHPLERVSQVLTRAGGVTGSRRRISVRHRDGTTNTADLVLYETAGDVAYNPYVLDGDVIAVPFADVAVIVSGAVNRPGSYELVRTKDLTELLKLAGGLKSNAVRSLPIRVIHRNPRQQLATTELKFSDTGVPNATLQDNDVVEVPGPEELQRTVLLIGAVAGADPLDTATTSKRLPYIEGDTVLSLINRAGGIKAPGDLQRSYISRPRDGGRPEQIPINLDSLLVKRDFSADRTIAMGDTIVVPPMQYSIRVEGAVARAGQYPFNPQFGIVDYVAHAGGRTRTAQDLEDIKLIDWSGKTHNFQRGMKPSPGDAILVPERNFSRAEIAQLVLAGAGLLVSGIALTLAATR